MKEAISEEMMLNYLQGRLSANEKEAFENNLKTDASARVAFFEWQRSMEERIFRLDATDELDGVDFEKVKFGIFDALGISAEDVSGGGKEGASLFGSLSNSHEQASRGLDGWWRWGGIAAAAVLLLGLIPVGFRTIRNMSDDNLPSSGPSLVVYDIADGGSLDMASIGSGENVREVLYINRDHYDTLSRAESYAEQLWEDYLKQRKENPDSIKSRGFVVLDLDGSQGFAGFYQPPENSKEGTAYKAGLWLADTTAQKQVPVGSVNGESGVFYFSLKEGEVELSTLNQFVPIAKNENASGI